MDRDCVPRDTVVDTCPVPELLTVEDRPCADQLADDVAVALRDDDVVTVLPLRERDGLALTDRV